LIEKVYENYQIEYEEDYTDEFENDYEYIQGSTVRKPEYDVYEQNKVLKAKKRYKSNRKIKAKMIFAIMLVLTAALAVMWRYAIITKTSYEINQKEKEYSELRNENAILRVEIESRTDLTTIKETAENMLGMAMPQKSQIVYIKIPRNDYTVLMQEQKKAPEDDNFINVFINKVASLAKLFE
jgi:cell division protein FtsL